MRIVSRPLAPREVDHELLWLCVSLGALGFGAIWFNAGLPWPVCAFHALTGHPCPTCGATRALVALLQGKTAAALAWNPLACVAYCALALFNIYALIAVVASAPRVRLVQFGRNEMRVLRALLVAVFLANWIYLLFGNPQL